MSVYPNSRARTKLYITDSPDEIISIIVWWGALGSLFNSLRTITHLRDLYWLSGQGKRCLLQSTSNHADMDGFQKESSGKIVFLVICSYGICNPEIAFLGPIFPEVLWLSGSLNSLVLNKIAPSYLITNYYLPITKSLSAILSFNSTKWDMQIY